MSKNINMTKGNPLKLLVAFALPLMVGNVLQSVYSVVDTIIVARGAGIAALAALGTVDWLNWMPIGIAQGFTQGFSVKMAQKYGMEDYDGLKHTVGQSASLSVLIAVIWVVISQSGLSLCLNLMQVPQNLRGMAEIYTRILMGGFPVVIFFNFCSATLRAIGDSKTPLKAMVISSVVNLILDCVAVFGLKWGIAGAAIATVISQCLSGLICLIKLKKTPILCFAIQQMKLERRIYPGLFNLGAPIAFKNIIVALSGMIVQVIVNGFSMGFIAGFTATGKLYGLIEIAAISYGYAVTTYVGQNWGAYRFERIKKGLNSAIALAVMTSISISAVMIIFGEPITMLFISAEDPAVFAEACSTAYQYLKFLCYPLPILYLLHIYQSTLQGIGRTTVSLVSGTIELVLRVGIAVVVGLTGYEVGIFTAEVAAWIGAEVYLMIVYYRAARRFPDRKPTESE